MESEKLVLNTYKDHALVVESENVISFSIWVQNVFNLMSYLFRGTFLVSCACLDLGKLGRGSFLRLFKEHLR